MSGQLTDISYVFSGILNVYTTSYIDRGTIGSSCGWCTRSGHGVGLTCRHGQVGCPQVTKTEGLLEDKVESGLPLTF